MQRNPFLSRSKKKRSTESNFLHDNFAGSPRAASMVLVREVMALFLSEEMALHTRLNPLTAPMLDFFLKWHEHIHLTYNTITSSWRFFPTLVHTGAAMHSANVLLGYRSK